jgi:hypothetical protein
MKYYEFVLDENDLEKFFFPIRNKFDIIKILMYSIKFMLIDKYITKVKPSGKIILIVNKASRLFFFTDKKYYTITFPFSIIEKDDNLIFSSKYIDELDSKLTSDIINLLKCNNNEFMECGYDFIEPILEYSDSNKYIWTLIHELIFGEDGYLRYDYDEEHQNGKAHPLNHYDIFYSSTSTFKIGLNNIITHNDLIDLVNLNTDCHFISK